MSVPQDYLCFCGKTTDPEWNRSDIAHSCGEVCNRDKVNASEHYVCIHRCTLLCHPGPCPSCVALVTRYVSFVVNGWLNIPSAYHNSINKSLHYFSKFICYIKEEFFGFQIMKSKKASQIGGAMFV